MVALIVLAVVAFLLFDAYILIRVLGSSKKRGAYGSVGVPGEAQVILQPGKVKVTYEQTRLSHVSNDHFEVPAGIQVTVTSPSGQPVELKGPGISGKGTTSFEGRGVSQSVIGSFQSVETGAYTFTVTGELPDAPEPRVLVGT